MNDDTSGKGRISKRKLLGLMGTVGGSAALGGVGTLALFTDEEVFGNEAQPNVIQAGELDLTVDWEVTYFGPGPSPTTLAEQDEPVDRPGPIVDLTDLKPGDIVEKTLSAHVGGNPGFLTFDLTLLADEDNGFTDPEDEVDGTIDGDDGTAGGDLAEHLNCVVWYDGFVDDGGTGGGAGSPPGNNRPDEGIWTAAGDPTNDADFEAGLDGAQSPSDAFDTGSDLVIASGTLADLADAPYPILVDSRTQGDTPGNFSDSACYDDGAVQYLGCVCWLPRNVAGVDDNILQTDRLEYQFSLGAVQCRDNVDTDGIPVSPEVAAGPEGEADGYVRGEVEDRDANPIAGVDVDIVDLDTGLVAATVETRSDGTFGPIGLPAGNYTAEIDGYTTFSTSISLSTNEVKSIFVTVE